MGERIIDYHGLPLHSIWDGSSIQKRLECEGCRFLVNAERDGEAVEICAWGVAWKELSPVEKPGKCRKWDKPPPVDSSIGYIKRLI
ncbi:MAG TPA: hypothetical protein VJ227_03580 [Patescibacteria group bacterium]|nr:hypothetical protein [Patescibacteria group bacterium]